MPVRAIVVRPDVSKGLAEEDDIATYSGNEVVSFGLCGADSKQQCELATGVSSPDRFTLLRRQALELSLYTLKYVDDVDSVIVFMPPSQKGQSNGSVFLRRSDVEDELQQPISVPAAHQAAPRRGAHLPRGGADHPADRAADVRRAGAAAAGRQPRPRADAAEPAFLT